MNFAINSFGFWMIYFTVIFSSTLFVIKSKVELNKFSIGSVVYYSIFLFAFLGYPAIYFKIVPYYINSGLTDNNIISKMFIISSLVIIQFFLGYYLCFIYLEKPRPKKRNFLNYLKLKYLNKKFEVSIITWTLFFIICMIFLVYYLNKVPNVALIEALKGKSSVEIAQSRSDMTNAFPKYHWFRIILKNILPFLSTISLLELLKTKSKSWMIVFILSFFVVCFVMLMDAQKAPIIWYFLSLIAVLAVYYNRGVDFKSALIVSAFALGFLFLSYVFFMDSKIEFLTILNPLRRGLTGQITPFYRYIEIIPDTIPFQYGKTFPNPRGIFPIEHFNYTVEISKIAKGGFNNGIISSAPTAFWGELWVNFGWYGIFIIPILFGTLVYLLHYYFSKSKLSTIGMALMVWFAFDLKDLAFTGFSGYLFPVSIVMILFICGVLTILNNDNIKRF
ncbi:MAG: oligosaccharide repeat unit polymerase [Tissierellia bacterium]|nr:oligosaccharide repeat unit polymerase [Tissierellia bacterium]